MSQMTEGRFGILEQAEKFLSRTEFFGHDQIFRLSAKHLKLESQPEVRCRISAAQHAISELSGQKSEPDENPQRSANGRLQKMKVADFERCQQTEFIDRNHAGLCFSHDNSEASIG